MAPHQPPNHPSPPDRPEDEGSAGPPALGASAAPPPYGTPPGQYGEESQHLQYGRGTDSGTDAAGQPHGQQPGYPQGAYPPGGYARPGYAPGPQQPYYQAPPPGAYQQGYPQGYPGPYGWAEPKSRLAGGLLGIFLGGLGIHRFYLGYTTLGIVQLLVTLFTFGAGAIWGFVEGIMILAGAQTFRTDARGVPLRE